MNSLRPKFAKLEKIAKDLEYAISKIPRTECCRDDLAEAIGKVLYGVELLEEAIDDFEGGDGA